MCISQGVPTYTALLAMVYITPPHCRAVSAISNTYYIIMESTIIAGTIQLLIGHVPIYSYGNLKFCINL